jgi:hypothetical protein
MKSKKCSACHGKKVIYHGDRQDYDIEPCPICSIPKRIGK